MIDNAAQLFALIITMDRFSSQIVLNKRSKQEVKSVCKIYFKYEIENHV